jgi:hypothetical protein
MPDNDPTQNPRDSGPQAANDADVDALLDQADELVADLSGQLGAGGSDPESSPAERQSTSDETSDDTALEAQLDKLDHLVGRTETEIGTVSEPKNGTTAEAKPALGPAPELEAPDPGVAEPDQAADKPGDVRRESSSTDGSPSDPPAAPSAQVKPSGEGEPSQPSSDGNASPEGGTPTPNDPPGATTATAPPGPQGLVQRAQETLCATLDLIDRPFARVSYRVRQVIGLCAIATFLVAVATLILSRIY